MGAFSERGTLSKSSKRLCSCTSLKKSCSRRWLTTSFPPTVSTSEMRESLEAIRRQHLEEIGDCHHRLILAESGSDRLQTQVMNPLARKVHEVDRQCASL